MFQYYYSVRVLPGQEPFNVWVGWVTSNFHQHDVTFDIDRVHTVTVTLGDDSGKVQERLGKVIHQNSYIISIHDFTIFIHTYLLLNVIFILLTP